MSGLVIVGASERTIWTEWLGRTLDTYGFDQPIWFVNPKYQEILGRPCYPTVRDLPEEPEIGVIAVGAERSLRECETLLEIGAEDIVLISNGFGETGLPEGREREAELRVLCADRPSRVIGPNCVGFARFHDNVCALAQPVPVGIVPGDVSVVSQSGGLSGGVLGALHREGLGIDLCYSIGNGVGFSVEDALEWALSRATTRIVCLVIETIRDPERLERAAALARSEGKEIVVLMLGTSTRGRRAAESHTGAVIGEQHILAAYLEKTGVLLAENVIEQARVAALVHKFGRPDPSQGAFVITASGGGAAMTADIAERTGVPMAPLSPATTERVREMIPPGPYIGNPLDVTAGNGPGGVKPVYDTVCAEPTVGLLIEPYVLPWPTDQVGNRWHRDALERVVESAGIRDLPVLVVSVFEQELSDWARGFAEHPLVSLTAGLEETMSALGKLYRAAGAAGDAIAAQVATDSRVTTHGQASILGEAEGRDVLEQAGLPVARGGVAETEDAAVALAGALRSPVVVKLGAAGIGHKGRIGGVHVGIVGPAAVRGACRSIAARARDSGIADGEVPFLVAEMEFGPELLIGAIRDRVVGPSVTVAIGGWAAESGRTFGTVALPLTDGEAARLVDAWGLRSLLGDARTANLASFLETLAAAFTDGVLTDYSTVEINPVILTTDAAVVADVLLVK
jgi:acyl-CoA synthetase (NDP forming)